MTPKPLNAECFLVLGAVRWRRDLDGKVYASEVKVRRVTRNRPAMSGEEIAVKLRITIPPEAFEPVEPDVVVVVGMRDFEVGVDVEPPEDADA